MKTNELNDDRIEEVLGKLPTIKDRRSKSEVYRSVKAHMHEPAPRKPKWFPALAAVVSVLLLVVLSFSLVNEMKGTDEATEKRSEDRASSANEDQRDVAQPLRRQEYSVADKSIAHPAVVPSLQAAVKEPYVTLTVADKNALFAVPFTFLVQNGEDRFAASSKFETVLKSQLGVEASALTSYAFKEEGDVLKLMTTPGQLESFSTTQGDMFVKGIQEAFHYSSYKKVELYTGNQKGAVVGNFGSMSEVDIEHYQKKGYVRYPLNQYKNLLVPTLTSYETIDEAVEAMKQTDDSIGVVSSVPTGVEIGIKQTDSDHITFTLSGSKVDDTEEGRTFIQALMLTARDFQYQYVHIVGNRENTIGGINLEKDQPVSLAPNVVKGVN